MTDFVFYGFLYSGFLICLILSISLVKNCFPKGLQSAFIITYGLPFPSAQSPCFFRIQGLTGKLTSPRRPAPPAALPEVLSGEAPPARCRISR